MIIEPTKYVANSGLAGLGSSENIVGSFSVGSQSVSTSGFYQHPEQTFATIETEFLATTLFNFSFESEWRTLQSFAEYTYNTSNVFVVAGLTLANTTNKFSVYLSQSYKSGALSILLTLANRSTITNPVTTPAFTFSLKSYVYKDPFSI
jgi:hypothetical protein